MRLHGILKKFSGYIYVALTHGLKSRWNTFQKVNPYSVIIAGYVSDYQT